MTNDKASTLQFTKHNKFVGAIVDSLLMIKRSSTHIVRNTDQLFGTFFQPIMFLALFTAVFGGAVALALPDSISYINFLMAGIIVQTVAFGSTTTAIAVTNDLQRGIVDRFRSLPMSDLAVLNGHVVSDVFRNSLSTVVMLTAGLLFGFRSNASFADWLAIAGIIILFTLAISWLAAIVGLFAKSVEGVQLLTFVLIFPLTFASSAFVPAESLSGWLRVFAENQPITHVIDSLRALLIGTPIGNSGWLAVAWCVGTLVVALPLAMYLFRKKTN